jgi:hypothetical protein
MRRYQHGGETGPGTDTLVALVLVHAVRFSDTFRLLNLLRDESISYSLAAWLQATSLDELRVKLREAAVPSPDHRWKTFLEEWGEWPTLISMAIPSLESLQHRLLRIQPEDNFFGLSPLIHSGAIVLLEEINGLPDTRGNCNLSEWERPIYAIQHKRRILCGYLDCDEDHIVLIPHSRSSARRISFLRHQVEVIGKWIGVASPLRQAR